MLFPTEPSIDFTTDKHAFVRFGRIHAFVPLEALPDLAPYYWLLEQGRKELVNYKPNADIYHALSFEPLIEYVLLRSVDLGVGAA